MSSTDPKGKTHRVRPQYIPDNALPQPLRQLKLVDESANQPIAPVADILHLAEAVPLIRERLDVPVEFTDDAILASLKTIATKSTDRDRWRAAFESNLARYLSIRGRDLSTALQELVALMPPPRS